MSNFEMILAAAKRLEGQATRTPLLSSPKLDQIVGRPVHVKAECLQRTGSFKFRGGWSAVSALSETERARGVIAFSSGNHAQGVALAAKEHDAPCVIIMPSDAPEIKIQNTKALGAEVVLYDRATEDRHIVADSANEGRDLTLIRPFDDHQVIAGQGTVGLEIAEQAGEVGINCADVLVCCGGGGLTSGIALALEKVAPAYNVRTCEPFGFDDVARSIELGSIQSNAHTTGSLCDAILTTEPGEITFPILHRLCGHGFVVTDEECLQAMAIAHETLDIILEPGGAAGLAAALFHGHAIQTEQIIVVATGSNVDPSVFQLAVDKYVDKV